MLVSTCVAESVELVVTALRSLQATLLGLHFDKNIGSHPTRRNIWRAKCAHLLNPLHQVGLVVVQAMEQSPDDAKSFVLVLTAVF